MRTKTTHILIGLPTFVLLLAGALSLLRADNPPARPSKDELAALASSLKWQTGTITLKNGLAKINLTDDFRFLDGAGARKVLHDIWGNPDDPRILGMIFPKEKGPLDRDGWGVTINYEEQGYVKDDDAEKTNYADLLKQLQDQVRQANPEREREGYPTAELIGWAAPPHYDKATHKLYWAKELKFSGEAGETLNYDIRILGRRGVLVLGAIASMEQFPEIETKTPELLGMIDFQAGNTYAEFDPKVDKVAEYGLAGLIAGGVLAGAAKLGLLKGLWVAVLALKKFLVIGAVALAAGFKKMMARFSGKSRTPEHLLPPGPPSPPP